MRTSSYSQSFFDEFVEYDKSTAYVRHANAVRKIATAWCKLLFPHIKSVAELEEEDLAKFKKLYSEYCLRPAVAARAYIYEQCKLIDSEYKHNTMPVFSVSGID